MKLGWQTADHDGKVLGRVSEVQEFLFDTNCLIDIYRGRRRIRPTFDKILSGEIVPYMSVITEAELWRGLHAGELERHQALVAQFTLLPLRSEAARLAGGWMQQYQAAGLGWMDAFITATGNVNDLEIMTRDKKLARLLVDQASFTLYE